MSDNWTVPPTSSLPQPPSPPPPDNRRGKVIIGAAVAVLFAIAVGLTVGLLRDDDDARLASGWREALLGQGIRDLVSGKAGLTFDPQGRLTLMPV